MAITGCSLSPQVLEPGQSDRVVAYNCKNVDPEQEPGEFDTKSYHTTWGSVWSAAFRNQTIDSNPVSAGTSILANMPPEKTYCMVFPEGLADVTNTVYDTISNLGLGFEKSSPESGEFVTTTVERSHGTFSDEIGRLLGAQKTSSEDDVKWRETYFVHITENLEGGTDVRVFRDVWISRMLEGERNRFIRETSDGMNEAWILLHVNQRLANNDIGVGSPRTAAASIGSNAPEPNNRELVRSVQVELKNLGLYTGAIDGLYGPVTRRAIQEYEKVSGLDVTGQPSELLLATLQANNVE